MRKASNRKQINRAFSFIACLSILALALPCNCMADIPVEPIKSEHPCHSSDTDSDQEKHSDGNCCCSDTLNLLTPSLSAEAIGAKNFSVQKQPLATSHSSLNPVENWTQFKLIRGSPPTTDEIFLSTSTFLAVIQRWLI